MGLDRNSVHALLEKYTTAWNKGDLEEACTVYSSSSVVLGSTETGQSGYRYTREGILEGYRAQYPDRALMGTLSFAISHFRQGGPDMASAIIQYARTVGEKVAETGYSLQVYELFGNSVYISYDATPGHSPVPAK
jgi:hypothetical protein